MMRAHQRMRATLRHSYPKRLADMLDAFLQRHGGDDQMINEQNCVPRFFECAPSNTTAMFKTMVRTAFPKRYEAAA